MASFLHVTDLHFGRPHNSVGIGKSLKKGLLPPARSLRTWMATHDRDVTEALTDLIVELKDEVDAVLLTGDIATTSGKSALDEACRWLKVTGQMAGKRMIALPGNHDRFHAFPSKPPYRPGAVAFDTALAKVPGVEIPPRPHDVSTVSIDPTCLLVCADLTLKHEQEANGARGYLAQGIVRRAEDVTAAITAALTAQTTHVVVATHFPLHPLPTISSHECIGGSALLTELSGIAERIPVLVISGHLHQEATYQTGSLFQLVGATASQTLHPASKARPSNLTLRGAHAAITIRTSPGGFVATRWRYGTDLTLGQTPPAKRFCEPTPIVF